MSGILVSQVALWIMCAINLILILVIYRQFGLAAMSTAVGHNNDGVSIGKPAPALLLHRSEQSELSEVSLDGSWSIVFFGTTVCMPCIEAMNLLDQAMPDLEACGVRVIAALDGSAEDVAAFAADHSYRFSVYADDDAIAGGAWEVRVTPFALLVDPGGIVRAKALTSGEESMRVFVGETQEKVGAKAGQVNGRIDAA